MSVSPVPRLLPPLSLITDQPVAYPGSSRAQRSLKPSPLLSRPTGTARHQPWPPRRRRRRLENGGEWERKLWVSQPQRCGKSSSSSRARTRRSPEPVFIRSTERVVGEREESASTWLIAGTPPTSPKLLPLQCYHGNRPLPGDGAGGSAPPVFPPLFQT
jgi:hypothetical protein